ncbi:hypothetical protein [Parolsenella catena]|nr:hypothetical protein [Parolsenella catena]
MQGPVCRAVFSFSRTALKHGARLIQPMLVAVLALPLVNLASLLL